MSTIKGKTGGRGTAAIARRQPATDGIVGNTTTQTGHVMTLVAEEGSLVQRRRKTGIED